jgi:hypothetical protein
MNHVFLVCIVIIWALIALYLAVRFRPVRQFLAGAFFESWGIQLYLYYAKVSVPLLGTDIVFTPQVSFARSFVHLILFLLCLYYGFFWKPKAPAA